jgi:hypothetical protein
MTRPVVTESAHLLRAIRRRLSDPLPDLLLARNPRTPPDVIAALAGTLETMNCPLFAAVCRRKSVPLRAVAHLEKIAVERLSSYFTCALRTAEKEAGASRLKGLAALAASPDVRIRKTAAAHPLCDGETLRLLGTRDTRHEVRLIVAVRLQTPPEVLEALLRDRSIHVRHMAARNPRIPPAALRGPAREKGDVELHLSLTENPVTPEAILAELADSDDAIVRNRVSQHWNLPAVGIVKLAARADDLSHVNLAKRSDTPVEVLARLAESSDRWVWEALVCNPGTPGEALGRLAGRGADAWDNIRVKIAQHPNSDVALLERLAANKFVFVREAVARNRKTSRDTLAVLAEDENEKVREAALRALADSARRKNAEEWSRAR